MAIDTEPPQLSFPLHDIPSDSVLVVRDLDVVGIGSRRRHQLQELQKTKSFILRTFALKIPDSVHAIYESEMLTTLQWLRPLRVDIGSEISLTEEHQKTYERIFPQTAMHLGLTSKRVRDLYLAEMEWSSWLLQDHWRYFAGFLRQKFPQNKTLLEVAHWEWVQAWIEVQPFQKVVLEKDVVLENPSLQIVTLTEDNSVLKRDKGLYALVYDDLKIAVTERTLDVYQAHILDLLREDRKYTKKQLVEMAGLNTGILPQIPSVEWENKFFSLVSDGILMYAGENS